VCIVLANADTGCIVNSVTSSETEKQMTSNTDNEYANNLYDSICNGKALRPSEETLNELHRIEAEAQKKVDTMTSEEKIEYFNKIMGR